MVKVVEVELEMPVIFAEFKEFVEDRSYLADDDSLESIFAEFDQFVSDRPYLAG